MAKNIKQDIQKFLREIEVHRSHGLFLEARDICSKLAARIRQSKRVKNKKELLGMVSQKIRDLEHDIRAFERAGTSVQMPQTEKDIIKMLRHPTKNTDDSAVAPGAEALMIFGQFEMALAEFNKLVEEDVPKVYAAKNILRCHIGLSALDDAISQYRQWFSGGRFSSGELGENTLFPKGSSREKENGFEPSGTGQFYV